MFFDKRVCHPERSAKHVVEGSWPVFLAFFIALLFAACTDYQDVFEDAFGDLEYAEEVDDSSSSTEAPSSDIEEKSSSSKAKSSSSREESSSSKAKSSSSKEESSSSKAKSSSSSEESSSSSSSSSVELDSVATLSMLKVFATDPTDAEASPLLSKDSAGLADSSSFNLAIQAPTAFIKVKPNAKKVAQVKVSAGKEEKFVKPDADGVYSFETPGQFTILDTTSVEIEVKSEDEKTVKKYTLSISSTLAPPTNLKLGKDANRTRINVNFNRSADSRVKGYVVLRSDRGSDSKQGNDLPESIENKKIITNNGIYNGFVSFLADADSSTYVDPVGGGSPYYAYRVYAYAMEGDNMVFSEGTEQRMRSVGRIMVEYKMTDFGSEYLTCSSGLTRADISAKVSLHEGDNKSANKLCSWEMFDYEAGYANEKHSVVYLTKAKTIGILDAEDLMPDTTREYASIIGKNGLYLYFEIIAECRGSAIGRATQGIYWPYEKMAAVLNGDGDLATGKNGRAPKRIEPNKDLHEHVEYLVGKGGIEYDDEDNECDDCGDEPHAGFYFGFKYDWVDDD